MLSENTKAYGRGSEIDSVDHVVSNASNIHKSVKSDLSAFMIHVKRLKREQVALKENKETLGLMLNKADMLPNQQHI
ncbi:hypothetical protein TSAR_006287 [Trichomalopsis sarcophagae]|uniref:Uncharacterized protein n=1 Tax=Trichomalopsis sarcophagae TaxID=543379 RepID=A0A232EMA0_9HYME|nr:hypothetical protein TSAR_006287 [Trichomalopsis sarcophagae]